MYTSGQGTVGDINIYRYEGELAIPCGGTREHGKYLWIDANGDGKEDQGEWLTTKGADALGYCVDQRGDIWIASGDSPQKIGHFYFLGFTERGVPRYGLESGEYEEEPFPNPGFQARSWGNGCNLHYDADKDVMVLIGPSKLRIAEEDPFQYMACYENWSKGNRSPSWQIDLPNPGTDPNFMYEGEVRPWGVRFRWMGLDVAGDKIFLASLWGEVFVFDRQTGEVERILSAGPEVAGSSAWEDAAMGLRAFKRKNGEYLIFTENSGWGGKNNFFRWKP
jgi:hypothetical protein